MPTEEVNVKLNAYWGKWARNLVAHRIRRSVAEVVTDGLKRIKPSLDNELDDILEWEAQKDVNHSED